MYREERRDPYVISDDPGRLDVSAVHAYLTSSYWAAGIPREIVGRSIRGSLCAGLFDDASQIGFARARSRIARRTPTSPTSTSSMIIVGADSGSGSWGFSFRIPTCKDSGGFRS